MKTTLTAAVVCANIIAFAPHAKAQFGPDLQYEMQNGTVTITGFYDENAGYVYIPATTNGLPVTSIAGGAFGLFEGENIYVPASVTTIAGGALEGDMQPQAIYVDPQNPFYSSSGDNVLFNKCQTTLIQCPESSLGCTIPGTVTTIGVGAFENVYSMESITIPSSVVSIQEGALADAQSLSTVYFEGNAPMADSSIFYDDDVVIYYQPWTKGWSNFSSVTGYSLTPWNTLKYTNQDGAITITGYTGFGGPLDIPCILEGAPVTSIGTNAFKNANLSTLTIPASVTNIGADAFRNCGGLSSVTIAGGVTNIGDDAFSGCYGLTGVYFLGNAPAANSTVFTGDNSAVVYYTAGTSNWGSMFGGLPTAVSALPFMYTSQTNSITITGYSGCVGPLNVPASINGLPVTGIGAGAFQSSSATCVTIPASVTNIGNSAFNACYSLTNLTISNGVVSLGQYAFNDCVNLTNVTLPDSMINLGDCAFAGCAALASVTISSNLTNIGNYAFRNCGNLTGVTIPGSVNTIGNSAFAGCSSLSAVALSNGVACIGDFAFSGAGVASVTFPGSLASIGYAAFSPTALSSVAIPASVTNIGAFAFNGCNGMSSITVDTQNPIYASANGVLFNKEQTTLLQYPDGLAGNYTVPAGVTNIAKWAFSADSSLTGVAIPNSVSCIGAYAFYNCASLATLTFDNGLTRIGDFAFAFNSSLTNVTIPASATCLGDNAFFGCGGLGDVYFEGNAPTNYSLFDGEGPTVYYLPGTSGWSNYYENTYYDVVLWNPAIQANGSAFGVTNGNFGFNIVGTNNFTVVVEACTNLTKPAWIPVATNTLVNGSYYFSEPLQTNASGRYFSLFMP